MLLGYSTLFGDGASSVNPLGDLWKTQIYALGEHLGIPAPLLAKAPTADLWPGQTDAGELGFDYRDADPVLYWHHEQGLGRDELVASGFPATLVDGVLRAYRRNRFKWRPTVVARVSAQRRQRRPHPPAQPGTMKKRGPGLGARGPGSGQEDAATDAR